MTFQEFSPSPHLRSYVDRYWLVETCSTDPHPMEHALTPNAMDGFVFQFQTQAPHLFLQGAHHQELPVAYGLMQPLEPWRLRLPAACCIAGMFFKPGVLHYWLRYPMHELARQPFDLEALLGKAVRQLTEQLRAEAMPHHRVLLENFVVKHLPLGAPFSTCTEQALRLLAEQRGVVSVYDLASELRVSRQFLARQFAAHVGVSPKQMGRVMRFNALHKRLIRQQPPNWLDLVYEFGYHDQAHLIKDFRSFTGASPTNY